jgi:hypothetical protein
MLIAVFDYGGNKLCELYNSGSEAEGQAYDICREEELGGAKSLTFSLVKHLPDGTENFRWQFIKNKYKIQYIEENYEDWYIIETPAVSRNISSATVEISCKHVSSTLSKRNIYLVIDDTNGIGTLQNLMEVVLSGTGWTLGISDTFYENDGTTEKIRSISSEGKEGAYALIEKICNLFNAYPVYNGADKTVDMHSKKVKTGLLEFSYNKNMEGLTKSPSSEALLTRMYVEGEYDEDSYIGIDTVNPTGLSFIMNFDYFKEIGVFGEEHQTALDTYLAAMSDTVGDMKTLTNTKLGYIQSLSQLWGNAKYVIYRNSGSAFDIVKLFGGATEANAVIVENDDIIVPQVDGSYDHITAGAGGVIDVPSTAEFIFKPVVWPAGGIIAGIIATIEAKEQTIEDLEEELLTETEESRITSINAQITTTNNEISVLYSGNETSDGLYASFFEAINISEMLYDVNISLADYQTDKNLIENTFVNAMGDLLQDGYWVNSDYIAGQEQFLYNDAVDLLNVLSRPEASYDGNVIDLSSVSGYEDENFKLNMSARIYDEELSVNDYVFITKRTIYPLTPWKNSIEFDNREMDIQGQTLDSVLSRVTDIANQLLGKAGLIVRASNISKDGSIRTELLNGMINLERQRIISAASNVYTDDNGNFIFEALDSSSAMMLTGNGFMIASNKNIDGSWRWRTFGTGRGFTADLITTGLLSAERIEAHSITVNHLASDVGQSLDLSSNTSVLLTVSNAIAELDIDGVTVGSTAPALPTEDQLWLDTTEIPNELKRWRVGYWGLLDRVTVSSTTPPLLASADYWIDTTDTPNELKEWDGTNWVSVTDVTIDSTAPSDPVENDIWLDSTDTPNVLKQWDGTAWVNVLSVVADTIAPSTAPENDTWLDTTNTPNELKEWKEETWVTIIDITTDSVAPATPADGDLWLDTTNAPNEPKKWYSSTWILVSDTNLTEAVNGFITEYNSSISQLKNSIESTVSSQIAEYDSGLQTSLQGLSSSILQTASGLYVDINSYEIDKEFTDGELASVKNITTNFAFDDTGFTISKTDSNVKIVIENDRMVFKDNNGVELAWISDSKLYINNAQIVQTMQLGGFQWVTMEDNSMALKWVGN